MLHHDSLGYGVITGSLAVHLRNVIDSSVFCHFNVILRILLGSTERIRDGRRRTFVAGYFQCDDCAVNAVLCVNITDLCACVPVHDVASAPAVPRRFDLPADRSNACPPPPPCLLCPGPAAQPASQKKKACCGRGGPSLAATFIQVRPSAQVVSVRQSGRRAGGRSRGRQDGASVLLAARRRMSLGPSMGIEDLLASKGPSALLA